MGTVLSSQTQPTGFSSPPLKTKIQDRLMGQTDADSPQYRLERLGPEALSDAELMAVVLDAGKNGRTKLAKAHKICEHFALGGLLALLPDELKRIDGINCSDAALLSAGTELAKRALEKGLGSRRVIRGAQDVLRVADELRD